MSRLLNAWKSRSNKAYLLRYLRDLQQIAIPELLEQRYQKFRRMGMYDEGVPPTAVAGNQIG